MEFPSLLRFQKTDRIRRWPSPSDAECQPMYRPGRSCAGSSLADVTSGSATFSKPSSGTGIDSTTTYIGHITDFARNCGSYEWIRGGNQPPDAIPLYGSFRIAAPRTRAAEGHSPRRMLPFLVFMFKHEFWSRP